MKESLIDQQPSASQFGAAERGALHRASAESHELWRIAEHEHQRKRLRNGQERWNGTPQNALLSGAYPLTGSDDSRPARQVAMHPARTVLQMASATAIEIAPVQEGLYVAHWKQTPARSTVFDRSTDYATDSPARQ